MGVRSFYGNGSGIGFGVGCGFGVGELGEGVRGRSGIRLPRNGIQKQQTPSLMYRNNAIHPCQGGDLAERRSVLPAWE